MSLHYDLNKMIWDKGYLSLDAIEAYCKLNHFKLSNAERRLRHSESPHILPVEKNGAIIGYEPNRNFPPPEEKEIYYHPPKLIKRNPHPIQVRETVEKNLALQVYKKEKVEEVAGLFN